MNKDSKHFESLYPEDTREVELSKIVEFIREGNSCQVVGIPGSGRSNLLGLLSYNHAIHLKHFPKNHSYVHFVKVDFSEVRGRPLIDAMKLLFLCISDSLRERKMMEEYAKIQDILKESVALHDELVLSQGLKQVVEYLSIEKKLTVILLLDRFEDYVPSLTKEFFAQLRILRNIAKFRFSVIFSVNRPLEGLLEPDLMADFYEFFAGHVVYLHLYDPVGVKFRIAYLEKTTGKKIDPEMAEEVIALTGGHGKLTKLSIEALLADQATGGLEKTLLERSTIQAALLDIWRGLTPEEQRLIEERDFENGSYLERVGLITEGEIVIPLFEDFTDGLKKKSAASDVAIVLDESSNTIKKGSTVISDSLTRAEFRLLRHLLQKQDVIIERDEVISVVWKEGATTEGVTDQAVDQLVFRIRRKIEDDPNNPRHLLTVKGRGFRFIP